MTYTKTLGELLDVIAVVAAEESFAMIQIVDLAIDSRNVVAGGMFCAYPGEQVDGRDFIEQAQGAGAVAILCESVGFEISSKVSVPVILVEGLGKKIGLLANYFFDQPSSKLQVFGITGTNGKTTCCYLLTQALEKLGLKAAMIGTLGVGELQSTQYQGLTTPSPIEVHRLMSQWTEQGITQVCMEVSSHALDQGRVMGVQFFCTLFTNLSHDHLDYHGDMQHYAAAKQRLFTDYPSQLTISNVDDALGARLIDVASSEFIATYGSAGDVSLETVELTSQGMTLSIDANGMVFELQTQLIGKINIPNILLLVATLLGLSTSVEDIQNIVPDLAPAPGRMELYHHDPKPRVVVDFAHTPDALAKALSSLRDHCSGQLWCVFGCGGDRDKTKRALMGAAADQYADRIIVTNDNPRSEVPEHIVQDILSGIEGEANVLLDRAVAIQTAIEQANSSDWVLIAGKGHETYQQVGDQFLEFSDRQHVAQIMRLAA